MKIVTGFALAAATFLSTAAACAGGEVAPPLIITEIRTLFSLQDAAANGSSEAVILQRQLLSQIKQRKLRNLQALRPDTLTAALIAGYVLSGGQPELAEEFAKADGIGEQSKRLLRGSAHYVRGESGAAIEQLKAVEPILLPLQIGGRFALAKAMLSVSDVAERERLLTLAIALMPGTLVEESALRRSATSQAELGNEKLFWNRTDRYLRRFRNSLYAPEFMAQAVSRVVGFEAAGKPTGLPRFDLAMTRLSESRRRMTYLQLAREAAAKNLGPLTQFAARRLRGLARDGSTEMHLADLYDSLHDVAGPHYEQVVRRLEGIDGTKLAEADRRLLRAALVIAHQIRAPSAVAKQAADEPEDLNHLSPKLTELIGKANAAIGNAGNLLTRTSQ